MLMPKRTKYRKMFRPRKDRARRSAVVSRLRRIRTTGAGTGLDLAGRSSLPSRHHQLSEARR